MKIKVLDVDTMGRDINFDILKQLGELELIGFTSKDDVISVIADANAIVINKIKITKEVLEACPDLKLICVFATGYDNIDINAAREKGVAVCNVPAYSTDSVMLFCVTAALSLVSRMNEYRAFVSSGEYTALGMPNAITPVFHEIKGLTWGIVGYGNIGRRVGEVARVLGANVIVNKRTPAEGVECVDIDELISRADIITLNCPLNEQTRGLISRERISKMKSNAILVNVARGAVTDEEAVADAILEGKIAGFAADVYSKEPFDKESPMMKLLECQNVILTPHAAWAAYEARSRCLEIIYNNIKAFSEGKIQNRVDI